MKSLNGINFIDLNELINGRFDQVWQSVASYDLITKDLKDKNLQSLLYHMFVDIIFDKIMQQRYYSKTCLYINKLEIKKLLYSKTFGVKDFCLFYRDFVKDIKANLKLNVIAHASSLDTFINNYNQGDAAVYEQVFKCVKFKVSSGRKIIDFLTIKGLKHNRNTFVSSPKLKMYICA